MKRFNIAAISILAALLIACLVAVLVTPERSSPNRTVKSTAADQPPVDMPLLETANRLAALAETGEEQQQAREAQQLADHERDEAFLAALRDAAAYKPPPTGPLRDLYNTISNLKDQLAADEARVEQLTKKKNPDDDTGQLDLANAQVALDKDEVADAQQDLARMGGDPHAAIQREMQQHEATEHQAAHNQSHALSPTRTLIEQVQTWFSLGAQRRDLQTAAQEVSSQSARLAAQRQEIEKQLQPANGTTSRSLADLQRLSGLRKDLASLNDRMQDCQQLVAAYNTWDSAVASRRTSVLHILLGSIAKVLAILMGALLIVIAIGHNALAGGRVRSTHVRLMATLGVEIVALVLILLVLFGAPSQMSTIIGLATAGITVVSKDFIVSFFGWFMLMGKNGIRVGDWVEINGVSGEVLEIGILKTVLLELGNWSETGQPTGRQVTFSNSYAMEGHYFNFSTSGQWLWDELVVTLPTDGDPYATAVAIRTLVEQETDKDSDEAAKDWTAIIDQYGARNFSAKPAVNLRPSGGGLEVAVRYITHAPERYETRARLLKMIVDLLHKPAGEVPAAATT